jgi:hypothetical protein
VSQVIAILLLILGRDHLQQFFILGTIALWIAVLTALVSGFDYYRKFNHLLSGAKPAPVASGRRLNQEVHEGAKATKVLTAKE